MSGSAKYTHLLNDKDVRRWNDNLAASSHITAEVYFKWKSVRVSYSEQVYKKDKAKMIENEAVKFLERRLHEMAK